MSDKPDKRNNSDRRGYYQSAIDKSAVDKSYDRRQDSDRRNYSDVVDFERRHHNGRREGSRRLGPRRQD